MNLKTCTYCQEEIPGHMVRCPYCCSILKSKSFRSDNNTVEQCDEPKNIYSSDIKIKVNKPKDKNVNERVDDNKQVRNLKNDSVRSDSYEDDDEYDELKTCCELKNWQKVFITAISVGVPVIGQLIGIIYSVVVLCCVKEPDKQSFARVLFFTAITVFSLACFFLMVVSWIFATVFMHRLM